MASSCGIHIDRQRFHLIALDGSPKKHRVSHHLSGLIPAGLDPIVAVSEALKTALKKKKLSKDNVGLVVDSGLAAFRQMKLPFDERSKIEEVLKFEVESDLPQWDIDDVVVDFLITDSKPGVESHMVVTAVPKERLMGPLAACERGGLEASEAELDGSAMFNAAFEAGVLTEGEAQVLVHVGDVSTTVVVADGGKLSSMRAIRAGALRIAAPTEAPADPPPADEAGETEIGETPAAETPQEDPSANEERHAETVQRIRRELVRTISGARTQNPIEKVWFCGHELPGLTEEGEVSEVPAERLQIVPQADEIPDAEAMVVAYGAALRRLGGGLLDARLRREELRFSGKFERVEMPLAVASLLLFFSLVVVFMIAHIQIGWRDAGTREQGGDMQLWLRASNVWLLPDLERGTPGRLPDPPEELVAFARKAENFEVEDMTKFEQIEHMGRLLRRNIDRLQRELGQVSEVVQPQSALEASTLILTTLQELGDEVGRYAIRSMQADYSPGRGGKDHVVVKLDMDFFGESDLDATSNYRKFVNAVEEHPWCMEFEGRSTNVLASGEGIYVDGVTIQVDTAAIAEEGEA